MYLKSAQALTICNITGFSITFNKTRIQHEIKGNNQVSKKETYVYLNRFKAKKKLLKGNKDTLEKIICILTLKP